MELELSQSEIDSISKDFPNIKTFLETYRSKSAYGSFTRITVCFYKDLILSNSMFRIKYDIPIHVRDSHGFQTYIMSIVKRYYYMEYGEHDQSIIDYVDLQIFKEFKKLMTSGLDVCNVGYVKNKDKDVWIYGFFE